MDIEKLIEQEVRLEFDDINAIRSSNIRSFLDEWVVTGLLGRGSFGNVYRIVKPHSDMAAQECALKVCPIYTAEDADLKKQEIETQQLLSGHPNAVQIEDYALIRRELPRTSYALIRMELLEQLPEEGLSEQETVRLGIDICSVLEKCASMEPRLVHCDIKPANILVDRNGRYKLGDFGTAKTMQATMTFTGNRGTPLYMAPEVAMYTGYDGRCDIYSLGYTMLTMLNGGKHPYADEGSNADIIRLMYEFNRTPRVDGVSPGLMKIIARMCEFSLSARYSRVRELKSDLEKIIRKTEEAERASKYEAELKGEIEKQKEKLQRAEEVLKAEKAMEKARQAMEKEQERLLKATGRKKEKTEARIKKLEVNAELADKVHTQVLNGDSYETACRKLGGNKGRTFLSARRNRITAVCAAVLVVLAAVGAVYAFGSADKPDGFLQAADSNVSVNSDDGAEADRKKLVERESVITENGIVLIPNDDLLSYKVTGHTKNNYRGVDLVIPTEYNGYPVTEIGPLAFCNSNIECVIVTPNIKKIGSRAFEGCVYLELAILSDTIETIGEYAFADCVLLTSIDIPDGVKTLENYSFFGCDKLKEVSLPDRLKTINPGAFKGCTDLKFIDLPSGLVSIGEEAFSGCSNIGYLYIPEETTNIGTQAFDDCGNIFVCANHKPDYYGYETDSGVKWILD